MVLVDTSVWISHFRETDNNLKTLLLETRVMSHPFIVGELACGNFKKRKEIILFLQALPVAPTVTQEELLYFIDSHKLMGIGIGFVDTHLLASALLLKIPLWTQDKKLQSSATKLGVIYQAL